MENKIINVVKNDRVYKISAPIIKYIISRIFNIERNNLTNNDVINIINSNDFLNDEFLENLEKYSLKNHKI